MKPESGEFFDSQYIVMKYHAAFKNLLMVCDGHPRQEQFPFRPELFQGGVKGKVGVQNGLKSTQLSR